MRGQGCDPTDLESFAEVIQCLSNLIIVTFYVRALHYGYALPSPIMQALVTTCGTLLRVIDLSGSAFIPSRHDWRSLLAAAPRLRVLRGPLGMDVSLDHIRPLPDIPISSELTALTLAPSNSKKIYPKKIDFHHLVKSSRIISCRRYGAAKRGPSIYMILS